MGFHTFDVDRADALDDPGRYRFCSREELLSLLDPAPTAVVADLGSGTGFYTDDVAPFVGTLYAVDVQSEMHDRYRERGVPDSVELVTAEVADLPFDDGALDAAFSTMTYHEFATDESLAELARVVAPGGRVVTVDWSARGDGTDGPPVDERYDLGHAVSAFADAGFVTTHAVERRETFVAVARRDSDTDR
jgi:ubiquinone/menaquinone biosynthesis C-methylase UbiE